MPFTCYHTSFYLPSVAFFYREVDPSTQKQRHSLCCPDLDLSILRGHEKYCRKERLIAVPTHSHTQGSVYCYSCGGSITRVTCYSLEIPLYYNHCKDLLVFQTGSGAEYSSNRSQSHVLRCIMRFSLYCILLNMHIPPHYKLMFNSSVNIPLVFIF